MERTTKTCILQELELQVGHPVSGQLLAKKLGITRAAVWKAIQDLRDEGYEIVSAPRSGYMLSDTTDILSQAGIAAHLQQSCSTPSVFVYEEIDSTNKRAKLLALEGASHGTAVVAVKQSEGRGRLGRSFCSPEGGIYLSIVIDPKVLGYSQEELLLLTSASAVAVSRAIREVCAIETGIKWVNDIYKAGKKVCGILVEGISDLESGAINAMVVGIGINFSIAHDEFPLELKESATSLYNGASVVPAGISRNLLAAKVIVHVLEICSALSDLSWMVEYRDSSVVIGRQIMVMNAGSSRRAVARDITEKGHLMIVWEDGTECVLNTGEVSIRPLESEGLTFV